MALIDSVLTIINAILFTDRGSDPTAPAAGKQLLFTKADGLYTVNSSGSVVGPMGSLPEYPWVVSINYLFPPLSQVNWSTLTTGDPSSKMPYLKASGAQNAELSYRVTLGSGTWQVDMMGYAEGDAGIITVRLDGEIVGTMDWYQASGAGYTIKSTGTFIVSVSATYTLNMKIETKNASSSGYMAFIQGLQLSRTA
jgi:hypothetical protein